MLLELFIQNIAIVSELRVRFGPGFTVLTGETGAGKSIVLGALDLALGERVKGDLLPDAEERGTVEALFALPKNHPIREFLRSQNLEPEEGEPLALRREIFRSGNHRHYVAGRHAPLSVLKTIGDGLVDFHGQHDHQSLFRPEDQLHLLDFFAGALELRRETAELHAAARRIAEELNRFETGEAQAREKTDFMEFQATEIAQARLVEGEEERLEVERNRLAHAEKLRGLLESAAALISEGEAPAVDSVGGGYKSLQEAARLDPELVPLGDRLREVQVGLKEAAGEIVSRLEKTQADPARLEEIEQRLSTIWKLKKKYGGSVAAALELGARLREQLRRAGASGEEKGRLRRDLEAARAALAGKAAALGKARRKAAPELSRRIESELRDLGMPRCKFETAWTPLAEPGALGAETAEFLIAPNPGEPPRPLRQTASGGELSRVMLAIKAVLAAGSTVGTLIFDEIDVNIGAAVGAQVGKKMAELSRVKQVLCITHLPQVASLAEHHFRVLKQVVRGRTLTSILPLDKEEKTQEVARMLSGEKITASALQHAQELIAERKKK